VPGKLPCAVCGVIRYVGRSSLPLGSYTCHPCRRVVPVPYGRRDGGIAVPVAAECLSCGQQFAPKRRAQSWTKCCSKSCATSFRQWGSRRDPGDRRSTRYARELATPGLTRHQRDLLRERWLRQQRPCFYCAGTASTVDHIVPLVRGGTNFEGNLVPACRPCNSSKRERLLVEWRMARGAKLRPVWHVLSSAAA
jgi:5-methylcytosine-specific restriction endonuclease McrA